jgi:hypothetical protein
MRWLKSPRWMWVVARFELLDCVRDRACQPGTDQPLTGLSNQSLKPCHRLCTEFTTARCNSLQQAPLADPVTGTVPFVALYSSSCCVSIPSKPIGSAAGNGVKVSR